MCSSNLSRTHTHSAGVLWKARKPQPGDLWKGLLSHLLKNHGDPSSKFVLTFLSFLLENLVGKPHTTGEIAKISLMERSYNSLEVQHIRVHGKSLWLCEALLSHRLYWNQRILIESNELMNLKVHICKECFIYSIMPETKSRLPCCRAWHLL